MADDVSTKEEKTRFLGTAMRGISNLRKPENLIKYSSLVILVIQNATQVLYLRWISIRPVEDKFLSTVCVFFQEVFKLLACIVLVCIQEKNIFNSLKQIFKEVFENWKDTLKVGVPALIYVIQNNLLYIAVANLPAAVFMITYQLKILTTALFTVLILRRRLSVLQWIALVFLFVGIALVQVDQKAQEKAADAARTNLTFAPTMATNVTAKTAGKEQNVFIGLGAVLTACILSGFAGIYFEKILKQRREVSVWLRNVQLAAISLPLAVGTVFAKDYRKVADKGFLVGFDLAVWGAVAFGAFGGLLVAVVIKFADNILKAFATSFAIVLACVCSVVLFGFKPSLMFTGGTVLVIGAVFVYSLFPYKKKYIPAATEPPPLTDDKKQANADV